MQHCTYDMFIAVYLEVLVCTFKFAYNRYDKYNNYNNKTFPKRIYVTIIHLCLPCSSAIIKKTIKFVIFCDYFSWCYYD